MKMKTLLWAFCLMSTEIFAQENLTNDALNQLKNSYQTDPSQMALRNAMGSNSIKSLVLNQKNTQKKNTYFSNEVKSIGITNQDNSGRCWLFTGLNVIRQKMIARHKLPAFEFSQVYLFFYDQLEKSNLFLQGIIDTAEKPMSDKMVEWLFKHPLSDGGTYTGVADLIMKYGAVPSTIMPETYASNNTDEVSVLMKRKLREMALTLREEAQKGSTKKVLEEKKMEMMKTIYRMLVLAYGEPVTSFEWAPQDASGKYISKPQTYTPKEFYKKFLGEDMNDVVMLMNDPSREYYKVYEIDYDRHLYNGHNWLYVNLPIEEIKEMAIKSIKDSTMMYFSCDVGKGLNKKTGWLDLDNYDYASLFGINFGMNKCQRVQSFDSGSSHAMSLMGVDLDEQNKPTKWKVENSWGNVGKDGHLIMTDKWFDEYMFRLVVKKKYASEKTLKLLKMKPILLPAWDPMFASEE